ncbi:hypothetical protein OAR97_04680 [Arcobacteraceae bacterium]|nr:hypothetical protein [Arcobacteraceae bacterium]
MIINSSKVKTEALLLFCRDLIDSYKNSKDDIFDLSIELMEFVDSRTTQLHKAINISVQPIDYYLRNQKVSRISMILKTYEFINKNITKLLQNNAKFNPSMLCFALLSTWFAELGHENKSKEFLFFTIYPYSEIYDKLLLKLDNNEYKSLNISMLHISEKTIFKLNSYRFK